MAIFTDNFNRSNRELNGDNGWVVLGGNGRVSINTNKVVCSVSDTIIREIGAQNFPIFNTWKYTGSSRLRYSAELFIGCDNAGASATEIRFVAYRSSSSYNNSTLLVSDGVNVIAGADANCTFEFSSEITLEVTINANGSGSFKVIQGASDYTLSWGARGWTNGNGNYAGFAIEYDTGGTKVDDVSLTYSPIAKPISHGYIFSIVNWLVFGLITAFFR